jgi:putative holliday junction resolvase
LIPASGRVLGFDLGSARIGVAISDVHQRVASALRVVARSGDPAVDRRALALLAAEEEVAGVVVGLPLSLDGSAGPAARAVLAEVEALGRDIGVPVETVDERFTTVVANQALRSGGQRGRKAGQRGRERVDAVAANLLLQSWLERRQAARGAAG